MGNAGITEFMSSALPVVSQKIVTAPPSTIAVIAPAAVARFQKIPASTIGVIVTPYIV